MNDDKIEFFNFSESKFFFNVKRVLFLLVVIIMGGRFYVKIESEIRYVVLSLNLVFEFYFVFFGEIKIKIKIEDSDKAFS